MRISDWSSDVCSSDLNIAVTDVDRLKADPYSFYARKMLGLSSLDPVDAEPSAAWRGTADHDVLEKWALGDDGNPARVAPRAMAMRTGTDSHPLIRELWTRRLLQATDGVAGDWAGGLVGGGKPIKG